MPAAIVKPLGGKRFQRLHACNNRLRRSARSIRFCRQHDRPSVEIARSRSSETS
jgi:hypothetical protein